MSTHPGVDAQLQGCEGEMSIGSSSVIPTMAISPAGAPTMGHQAITQARHLSSARSTLVELWRVTTPVHSQWNTDLCRFSRCWIFYLAGRTIYRVQLVPITI